jgi:hypothetical protein
VMRLARTAILVTPADLATDWLEETAAGGSAALLLTYAPYCSRKWATVAMPL